MVRKTELLKGSETMKVQLTIEEKESILSQVCLRCEDIMKLTGFSKSNVYKLMNQCRQEFQGKAGVRTDAITTTSLCQYIGIDLEQELATIMRAKKLVNDKKEDN